MIIAKNGTLDAEINTNKVITASEMRQQYTVQSDNFFLGNLRGDQSDGSLQSSDLLDLKTRKISVGTDEDKFRTDSATVADASF
jgi:hypothetical protein